MGWSVNDLSSITDLLIQNLKQAILLSPIHIADPFFVDVTGLMPEVTRTESSDQLNLYLLHVSRDPYWRNTPTAGQRGLMNEVQPLSLNLSYLLTSYAEKSWVREQQMMSIALAYFHNNPIYRSAALEFTITVEADSIEEMSRLWQAITVPIRLSAMFRVAVVFLSPPNPPAAPVRPPVETTLSVGATLGAGPTPAGTPPSPQLFQVAIQTTYTVPPPATQLGDLGQVNVLPPAQQPVLVGGDSLRVRGSELDIADAAAVYLTSVPGGVEWPITAWRTAPPPQTAVDPNELVVVLPAAYAAPPAAGIALGSTPLPGLYKLTVGAVGGAFRSAALPVAIAAGVDQVTSPAQLVPAAGIYTLTGRGFVPAQTAVFLDSLALTQGAAAAPGVFAFDATGAFIAFQLPPTPAGLSGTFARVRIVVNSIESPPGWWIQYP